MMNTGGRSPGNGRHSATVQVITFADSRGAEYPNSLSRQYANAAHTLASSKRCSKLSSRT